VDDLRHIHRQVVHLAVAPGFQQNLFLINHVLLLRGMERERNAISSFTFRFPDIFFACIPPII
jgi:hypothetical protein